MELDHDKIIALIVLFILLLIGVYQIGYIMGKIYQEKRDSNGSERNKR